MALSPTSSRRGWLALAVGAAATTRAQVRPSFASLLLIGLCSITFVQTWVLLESAYWLQDDFLNFALVSDPYDNVFQFLGRAHFGRFAPTHRLQYGVLWWLGGRSMSWPLSRFYLASLSALSVGLFGLVIRGWAKVPWADVWCSALFGLSCTLGFTLFWLASAAHVTAQLVLSLGGLLATRRFCALGHTRWVVVSTLCWGLALGAYEKALLIIPLLGFVEWHAAAPQCRTRVKWPLIAFGVVAVAFLSHAWLHGMSTGGSLFRIELLEGLSRGARRVWPQLVAGQSTDWASAVSLLVIMSTVLWSRRKRRTVVVWLMSALACIAFAAVAASKRLDEMGAAWGDEPRYFFEWWPAFLVAVALTLADMTELHRRRLMIALSVLFAITVPIHFLRARAHVGHSHDPRTRDWVANVLTYEGRVVESEVPSFVVEPWYYPYSRLERVIRLFRSTASLVANPAQSALRFDDLGRRARVNWAAAGQAHFKIDQTTTCHVETQSVFCLKASTQACRAQLTFDEPLASTLTLRAETVSGGSCVLWHLAPSNGWGIVGQPRCEPLVDDRLWFHERAGLHLTSVEMRLSPGAQLCVTGAEWGDWRG